MIVYKSTLSDKEKKHITSLLYELADIYGDFYITRDNLRLFIKENPNVLFECLRLGDKMAFDDNGMAVVCGFSDKSDRKYLKILTKDVRQAEGFLKVLAWHLNCDLWIKVKRNNPLKNVLERNYFRFVGSRGKEILFVRKARKYDARYSHKDQSADSGHNKA